MWLCAIGTVVHDGGAVSSGGPLPGLWRTTTILGSKLCLLIPWNSLKDCEVSPAKNVYAKLGQRKTFAQALGTTCDIPLFELPTPCIKGDMIVVWIHEVDYLVGLEDCKTHLHGRVILSKGDKPLTHMDLTKSCSRCGRLLDRGKQKVFMSLSSLL